jgi:hypothetical protein
MAIGMSGMSGTGGNGLTFVLVNILLIDLRDEIFERIDKLEVFIDEVDRRLYAVLSIPMALVSVNICPLNDVLCSTAGATPMTNFSE